MSSTSALNQINNRLDELKIERNQVEGSETEVYARIVGYYRSVRNWNKGKKEEYRIRENFKDSLNEGFATSPSASQSTPAAPAGIAPAPAAATQAQPTTAKPAATAYRAPAQPIVPAQPVVPTQHELFFTAKPTVSSYLYFYRKTCPNCPPVLAWLESSGIRGREVDVDRDSGMIEAALFEVISAPTVIILDENGEESGRACNVAALDSLLGLSSVAGA